MEGDFEVAAIAREKLAKLKRFEILGPNGDLLPYIQNCQLRRMEIYQGYCNQQPQQQAHETLLNFLAAQNGMQEMVLQFDHWGSVADPFKAPFSDGRKKLSLSGCSSFPWQNSNNLMAFLKLHKETLEVLDFSQYLSLDFIVLILRDFK